MSRFLITRRAGLLTAAATAAVLGTAAPALAGVTVEPATAPQGGAANLNFTVTNTAQSPITRLKLVLPADTPIAEVYPLSVDDWAPLITNRKLATPLTTIHGGTPATEATADITWIAMPGKPLAAGKSTQLGIAVGPLPTLSQMLFTFQATYADGTAGVAMPPAALKLTPATAADQAAQAAEHSAHDGGAATDGTGGDAIDPDAAQFQQLVDQAGQGTDRWAVLGWIVAALAGAAALVTILRGRRRATGTDQHDEPADDVKETVGAGAGKTRGGNWRYQDGPE